MLIHKIIDLIENGIETNYLDFKEKMYSRKGAIDLLKDILAMANSAYHGEKYIIMGIKDDVSQQSRIVKGISNDQIVDASDYQEYVLNNIEPDLHFDLHYLDYQDKKIAVIAIDAKNRPYLIKKQNANLHQGYCQIRKGSTNSVATRADFDGMYQKKNGLFEVRILDGSLRAINDVDGTALLDVSFRNLTENPVTICKGALFIRDQENNVISNHGVYGLNNEVGADFRLEVPPKRELTGDLHLGFGSSDSLRLKLNEFGTTNELFVFDLRFLDTNDNEYRTIINDGFVYAKGKLLWKVKLRKKSD